MEILNLGHCIIFYIKGELKSPISSVRFVVFGQIRSDHYESITWFEQWFAIWAPLSAQGLIMQPMYTQNMISVV